MGVLGARRRPRTSPSGPGLVAVLLRGPLRKPRKAVTARVPPAASLPGVLITPMYAAEAGGATAAQEAFSTELPPSEPTHAARHPPVLAPTAARAESHAPRPPNAVTRPAWTKPRAAMKAMTLPGPASLGVAAILPQAGRGPSVIAEKPKLCRLKAVLPAHAGETRPLRAQVDPFLASVTPRRRAAYSTALTAPTAPVLIFGTAPLRDGTHIPALTP